MGKVNVYLPDDLERAVREAGVPVSSVCQAALQAAVDAVSTIRTGDDVAAAPAGARLTPRLAQILATRPATALELLGGIILHGENLGARVLADLGVELPPRRAPKAKTPRRSATRTPAPASAEVREVLVAAYRVALELHHGYLGAEHVVIALAQPDAPTADLFAALGLDDRAVRTRVVRLLSNPWRADRPALDDTTAAPTAPTAAVFERFEAELRRLATDLEALRGSAKLPPWPPAPSS